MPLELREGDFDAFFEAPFACYGADSVAAFPMRGDLKRALDAELNPLFRDHARRTWYTAHREGRIVGRVLAHVHDASNQLHNLKRGFFGCLDCIDDLEVARALLDVVFSWLHVRGCTEIAGGFNLTITQMIGVVTEGFDSAPYTYQDYAPPHVARLLDALGYERFFPMTTFELDLRTLEPARLLGDKQRKLLANPQWSWHPVRRQGLEDVLRDSCSVLNDGFKDNPMFVPLTQEEFLYPCEGMTWVIDQHISMVARERGQAVGVLLCIPDLNPFLRVVRSRVRPSVLWHLLKLKLRPRRASVIFFSVRRSHHNLGVNGVLLHKVTTALRDRGYTHLGISWVSDSNAASHRQMQKLAASPLHRLHLFRKALR
jgi:GNAT superfamily N-acetyltransferase